MLPHALDAKCLTVCANSNDKLVIGDIHHRALGYLGRLDLDIFALGILWRRQDGLAGEVICLVFLHADDLATDVYIVCPSLVKFDIS